MTQNCSGDEVFLGGDCTATIDSELDRVSQLLPQGRAWPRDPETMLMKFWKSFADVTLYVEQRICALADEFFCDTANETLPVWLEQYGIGAGGSSLVDPACLKPTATTSDVNAKLCAAVAAQGGSTAGYLEQVALALGYVVSIADNSDLALPLAGLCQTGCVSLGPPAIPKDTGSALGIAALGGCEAADGLGGQVAMTGDVTAGCVQLGRSVSVDPATGQFDPDGWGECATAADDGCDDTESLATDPVTGDPVYTYPEPTGGAVSVINYCTGEATNPTPNNYLPMGGTLDLVGCDTTGGFDEYIGHAHTITVTVDMAATMALQEANSSLNQLWPMAGCASCGDPCLPLRNNNLDELIDKIDEIKPAHVVATYVSA